LITVDTSGLVSFVNRRDPAHRRAIRALATDPGPRFLPEGILSEVAYLLERALLPNAFDRVLQDVTAGEFTLYSSLADIPRIRHLIARYRNLPLGFADAAVIACAERHGG
jgi:uncharacterized protein